MLRINLETFEMMRLMDGLDEIKFIYSMIVAKTSGYQNELLVFSTGSKGLQIFDVEMGTRLIQWKVPGENILMQGFIRSIDTIVSGSGKGILRLHDASDLELLSQDDTTAVHELCQLDSGIRAMQTSTYPEEKFFAVGTSKGTVTVFEVKYLRQKKAFKYQVFRPHKEQVNDLKFIKKGDEFLLASLSGDGVLNIVCLQECVQLYRRAFGWDSISELATSPSTNTFLVLTRKSEVLKFRSSADEEFVRQLEDDYCNDLDDGIKRTILTESSLEK